MKQRILLFGGAFDPIHRGHLGLLNVVKRQLMIDDVYLVPTSIPVWKEQTTSIEHRLKMLEIAIKPYEGYHIATYELNNDKPSYTIDTIMQAEEDFPDAELFYLIGSDQAALFDQWKDSLLLAQKAQIIVYLRPNYPLHRFNVAKYHMMVIEGKSYQASSTEIRQFTRLDTSFEVIEYILNNNLYFAKKLKAYYEPLRFKHVIEVARLAYQIALSNKLDTSKAMIAALLHDVAKNKLVEDNQKLTSQYYSAYLDAPKPLYHQFAGAVIAKVDFAIEDEIIIEAIAYHASGKEKMSWLGQIVYAADKIEPTRPFDSSELINSCLNNFHQGFIDVLVANKLFHQQKNKPFDYRLTQEAINYYLGGK